ncbi:hypothetical protein [Gordonia sp. SND2]|uniref:hypothetical protein n=1 Tax=Gordonia sp. SND2 TaxID=3388659 RepID=UPI00398A529E
MTAHDASKLAPLPFRVRPLQCETTKSFRERIATRNHISASAWPLNSRGSELKSVLARLASIKPVALVTALPELRSASDIAEYPHLAGMVAASAPIRPACQLCVAARDSQAAGATVFASHEQVICYRHSRWTGGGTLRCSANEQFSVSSVPEVPSANVRHHRLIARFGRGAVHTTFHDALSAMLYWHDWSVFARDPGISHRRQALGLPPDIHGHNPRDIAAWYPNAVAMTELVLRQILAIRATSAPDPDLLAAGLQEFEDSVIAGLRPSGANNPFIAARRQTSFPAVGEVENTDTTEAAQQADDGVHTLPR